MNANDDARMLMLSHTGISVWRVTKLSKKAAVINIGISPTVIFMPSFAPLFNDANRV